MPNAKKRFDPREKNFLVTFSLFFIMFRSIRDGTFFLYPYLLKDAPTNIVTLLNVTNIITIIALGLIYSWFKIGFWMFLAVQIANMPLCLMAGIGKIHSLFGVFSAVLLWLFLQIPKDGYSGWDYLSGRYKTIRDTETTVKNKKCRMCNAVYTGSLLECPACGSSLYEETTESIYNNQGTGSREKGTEKMSNEQVAMSSEKGTDIDPDNKNAEIERLEKLFDATSDEKEKSLIAKQLYELGVMYYWRFIPRDRE